MTKPLAQPAAQTPEQACNWKIRAEVFAEIHHHWEFRAKDEADFDDWLHENIKEAEAKAALRAGHDDEI